MSSRRPALRAAVSFAFSLFNTIGALLIPCTGMIIDRFGARRVILVFTILYGLVLCSALWAGSSLWQLYLLFTVLGAMMAGLGIVGEYIGRIYQEVRRRPRYVVRRTYGFEE